MRAAVERVEPPRGRQPAEPGQPGLARDGAFGTGTVRWRRLGLALAAAVLLCCTAPVEPPSGAENAPAPSPAASAPPGPPWSAPGDLARPAQPPRERITFAQPGTGWPAAPAQIAAQQGFFHEEGLEVALPVIPAKLLAAGMAAGEVDYSPQVNTAIRNALVGLPVRLVAVTVDKSTRRLLAVPEIQSAEQLRGRGIVIDEIGGGLHTSGVLALQRLGLDPHADVTWLAHGGQPAALAAAVREGRAHAAILPAMAADRAEAFGLAPLLPLDGVVPLPESGVSTRLAKLETERGQVKRVLRAVVRALRYLQTDRMGSVATLAQLHGVPPEQAGADYDAIAWAFSADGTVSEERLRYAIEAETALVELVGDVPFARVADFGPLYEALGELEITPAAGAAR